MTVNLSRLPKTWLVDIDGTIFVHNGHLQGEDQLLPGVVNFFSTLPATDEIILLTARSKAMREATEEALRRFGIRWNRILFDLPTGERLLINDCKPSGLTTAYAFNIKRDEGMTSLLQEIVLTNI